MSPEPDYEKTARDAIVAQVKEGPGAPAQAAQVACQLIAQAGRTAKDVRLAVYGICKGVMGGLLLKGLTLPETAVAIMQGLSNISLVSRAGPQDLMTWVMEGIAEIAPLAGMNACIDIKVAMEEHFMGTGILFDQLCRKAIQKTQPL